MPDTTMGKSSSPAPTSQPPITVLPSMIDVVPYPTVGPITAGTPLPFSSSDPNLNQQPTQSTLEPITEAPPTPPPHDDSEKPLTPIERPSSPGNMPPVT